MGSPTAKEKRTSSMETPERVAREVCLSFTGMDVSKFSSPVSFPTGELVYSYNYVQMCARRSYAFDEFQVP